MAKSNDKYIKLRNNHSLKASNVAGDNTIDIIKVNTSDIVEFPSFPLTPSSAPVANYEVANKLYVDNAVSGVVYFNAGESIASNTTYFVRLAIDGETVGRIYKADSDASTSNKYWTIGVVKSASLVNIGDLVAVQVGKSHTIGSNNTAFSSSDIGQPVYLISGGGFSTTAPDTVGQAVMRVGIVQTTTSIWIEEKQLHGVIDSLG